MAAMPTCGSRQRRWRAAAGGARVKWALMAVAALIVLSACGSSKSTTTTSTTHAQPVPAPHHQAAVDNFQWPYYGYDAARTRFFAGPRGLAPPFRQGWSYQDYALLEFPPVMYHGSLYFIDFDGSAKRVNKANGHLIWQRKLGTLAAVTPAYDPTHKLVFFPLLSVTRGARLPGNGRFVALSMKNGRVAWSHPLPPGSESSPLVVGNSVYVGSQDGTVYSFRTSNGHVNWTFHAAGAVKGGPAYAAGNIYFGDYASRVYAVSASTGREQWATTTDGGGGTFYASPAIAFGKVFIGNTDDHVYAFSRSSGRLLWDTPTSAYVYSSPAVANISGLGPTVYSGSYDGDFYALDANTGAVRWSHSSGGRISGSGTIIGNVIYYSVLGTKITVGLGVRRGNVVFTFRDGEFAGVIADRHALYAIGYSVIYQLLPKH
jgi:outer membrane protein assembly factor BamB